MLGTIYAYFALFVFSMLIVHSQTTCPVNPPRLDATSNCTDCVPGLDLSTGCSTCEGAESIGCVEGNQDCSVGDFTFSALFHSYENPNSTCGECGECEDENKDTGRITCLSANANPLNIDPGTDCGLRFLYCLRPHGSPAVDVPLSPQPTLPGADNVTFDEGFMIQGRFWNRSNPFTRNFQLWPGRAQFYIVVYHFSPACVIGEVVDRLLIDMEFNISSDFTERRTYYGNLSIAQFDLSFRIDGQCLENYYGPQCNIFCSGVEGQFTCDSEGSIACVHSNRSPESRCTECLAVGGDPDNNCGDTTTMSNTDSTSTSSSVNQPQCLLGRDPSTNCTECFVGRDPSTDCVECLPGMYQRTDGATDCITAPDVNLLYGVIGGLSCCVLLLFIISFALLLSRQKKTCASIHAGIPERPAQAPEVIKMTENQVYGVPLSKDTGQEAAARIVTEDNVGYGVTSDGGRRPQLAQDESYEYI